MQFQAPGGALANRRRVFQPFEGITPSPAAAIRRTYLVFALPAAPVELPLEPLEPMPLLEPELPALLGEVVELGDELELLPPLAAPELDLLKCASHSEREICPSLLVSTDEKVGVDELLLEPDMPLDEPEELEPPEAALPLEDLSDEPDVLLPEEAGEDDDDELLPVALGEDELLPDAAGEDDEEPLLPDADGVDEDELCATATLDSANSAAAVAALRTLSFIIRYLLQGWGGTCPWP